MIIRQIGLVDRSLGTAIDYNSLVLATSRVLMALEQSKQAVVYPDLHNHHHCSWPLLLLLLLPQWRLTTTAATTAADDRAYVSAILSVHDISNYHNS